MFWVYVMENPRGEPYIGHTDNLTRRMAEHNSEEKIGTKYTHKHGPCKMVWSEEHSGRASAMARERAIKAMKSTKWIRRELLKR